MVLGDTSRHTFLQKLKNEMEVIAADGNHLGHVKEVRPSDFLLHRPLAVAVFVPFSAIDKISETENRVVLNVSEGQIAEEGWPSHGSDPSVTKPLGGT